jgi:hypothetical protein
MSSSFAESVLSLPSSDDAGAGDGRSAGAAVGDDDDDEESDMIHVASLARHSQLSAVWQSPLPNGLHAVASINEAVLPVTPLR